jgi:DNA end-binding protein Ku
MAPRSSWKGYLKLSLVSVPVKAYTASASGAEIHLNQLHRDCHSPIKYKKVCPIHGEVGTDEIVSGYQYAKGQYVEIDPDELDKLRTESDRSINVDGFISGSRLDPLYYSGKSYYLVPDGPVGQKPYALLHQAMAGKGLCALAQIVLSRREQLVLLRPVGKLIVMSVLSYDAEVKKPESFEDEVAGAPFSEDELALTGTLVDATTREDLDYAAYTDAYVDKLTRLIEAKVEGKEIVSAPVVEEAQVLNLMDALKASVQRAAEAGGARAPAKAKLKMAPSARETAEAAKKKRKKKSG